MLATTEGRNRFSGSKKGSFLSCRKLTCLGDSGVMPLGKVVVNVPRLGGDRFPVPQHTGLREVSGAAVITTCS